MGKLKTVAQAVALSLALLPLWNVVGEGSTS
jgi:CDP-diacylglycerol--glycerol-3-phosphate 3-phosphatidyltransferase